MINIKKFSSRKRVQKVAVENFLSSLSGLSYQEAVANCELDTKAYKWNLETVAAIREGILEYFY